MAAKRSRLIVLVALFAVLAGLTAILVSRRLSPSTLEVVNASGADLTDVQLRFTVGDKPMEYKIDRLAPDEARTVTIEFGSGDFPFAATYRQGPFKINCDPGISIKGRGERMVLRISEDKYEVVRE